MKKSVLVSLLLVTTLVLTGTALFAAGSTESGGPVKIRVGTMPNHIGVPIQYAAEKGLYKQAGLDVEVILFPTGAPINEALSAEKIDLAGSGMASVFALASGDAYWLGDYVKTVAGLGVYVRPGSPVLKEKGNVPGKPNVYGSKATVKGLVILGALGTSDQFEAVAWAQSFGLTGNDIQMLNMDRGPAVQAFKTGQGDAIACGGPPYNYELEAAGFIQAAGLTDVSGMDIADGMLGRKKFIDAHPEEVKKFIQITYSVIDQLFASDKMLADYAMAFYNQNGKNYTPAMMNGEIKDKDYIGKVTISSPDYLFGSTMVGMGGFYVKDGKIEPNLEKNIYASLRPDFLESIYGIKITRFSSK